MSSSTGGYLSYALSGTEDRDFLRTLHSLIVGVTGLNPEFVRPMWQSEPAQQPAIGTEWVSFGVISVDEGDYQIVAVDDNNSHVINNVTYEVLIACYGLNAKERARSLKTGLMLRQNSEEIEANKVYIHSIGGISFVPFLSKEQWYYRADFNIKISAEIVAQYPIERIIKAEIDAIAQEKTDITYTQNAAAEV